MRVAVCDDEKAWVKAIEEHLIRFSEEQRIDIDTETFYSGEQLVGHYKSGGDPFDVLILDIELEGLSGIETAMSIRGQDESVNIFFMTSHRKYVYDCFKPMPVNFWVKPVGYETLRGDLAEVAERLKSGKSELVIKSGSGYIKIEYRSINFLTSSAKKIIFHTEDGNFETYGAMKTVIGKIGPHGFSSPHKSYCVNLDKVRSINGNDLIMKNGDVIPVSKSRKQRFKKDFLEYVSGERYDIYGD